MRYSAKLILSVVFLSFLGTQLPGQADSTISRFKRLHNQFKGRSSAYDTNAIYFNKWKVNLKFDVGTGIDNGIFTSYSNSTSLFGIQNPAYNIVFSPVYCASSFYGVTEKSAIGVGLFYQYLNYVPQTAQVLPEGSASEFTITAGYLHCIHSWRYFYYGFEFGAMFLNTDFDTNTYFNKPKNKTPLVQPVFAEIIGFRYPVEPGLWLNIEACSLGLLGSSLGQLNTGSIGIDYCIDTRPLCHKPVKQDPYYSPKKVYRRERKDSIMRSKPKYKELHDTNSMFYNKYKLHFSIESGSGQLEALVSSYFGYLNSAYSAAESPLLRGAVDYGLGVKSSVGLSLMFEQVNYEKVNISSYYTSGNITYLNLSARYTHTLFASNVFYYGVEAGIYSLGFNYNKANTFYNPPPLVYLPGSGLSAGLLFGMKTTLTKNISIHGELVLDGTVPYADYGITYTINSGWRLRK